MQQEFTIKTPILGASSVGKSSILLRFVSGKYDPSQLNCIGCDFLSKIITVSNTRLKLQLWDTAGQERFVTISRIYYKNAKGIIIVYDISNLKSFEAVDKWMDEVQKNAPNNAIRILIANKIDLKERVVSYDEGMNKAKQHNALFIETSAKTGENIDYAFQTLANSIYTRFKDELAAVAPLVAINNANAHQGDECKC